MKKFLMMLVLTLTTLGFVHAEAEAQTVNINNTTNWQYMIEFYDVGGTQIGSAGIGALTPISMTLGTVPAYCRITIGLSGLPPGPGDRITIGNTPYPSFASSMNTYAWFGGLPYNGFWSMMGSTVNITIFV